MPLPNFLIIGAPRSGTTSLHYYLDQHPQVYMPARKELRFFALENQELNYKGPADDGFNRDSVNQLDDYLSYFADVDTETAIGESCPLYLRSPEAPLRIKNHIPNVKLIAILRHPVERAYSDYLQMLRLGHEILFDFDAVLEAEAERMKAGWGPFYAYVDKGFYAQHLENYYAQFEKSQIRVYLFEDLQKDPAALLRDIFSFLDISDSIMPDAQFKHNQSNRESVNSVQSRKTLLRAKKVFGNLLNLIPNNLKKSLRQQYLNMTETTPPPLRDETRQSLLDIYHEDILHLQSLLQRDLSHWL